MKIAALLLGIAAAAVSGCATMQSYSMRTVVSRPPYYQTLAPFSVPEDAAVGHFPVQVDGKADLFGRGRQLLGPLLDSMNAYLDDARWTVRLDSTPKPATQAPWFYVGSAQGLRERTNLADSTTGPVMVMQTLSPSRNWSEQLRAITAQRHLEGVLVISIGPADYYLHQRGYGFRKEMELGTGYSMPVEWLNDLDQPVQVLHLTGLLLSSDGTVLRAGAEGIMAKRPSFERAVIHLEDMLTDEDVASLLTSLRRDDLDGHPLAWQVALYNLVHQLLGRTSPTGYEGRRRIQ